MPFLAIGPRWAPRASARYGARDGGSEGPDEERHWVASSFDTAALDGGIESAPSLLYA